MKTASLSKSVTKPLKKRELEESLSRGFGATDTEPLAGHRYSERIIRLCVKLYVRTKCGFRAVAETLKIFNEEYGGLFGREVSHTSIENWVKTCGYGIRMEACKEIKNMKYAFIIDESITIGSQKLLLVLAIPSEHKGHALKHQDVTVAGMYVAASWTSVSICEKLKSLVEDIGKPPDYILSDNGHNLVKASELAQIPRHRDISHTLGLFLEEAYKKGPEFNELTSHLGKARLKYHLTDKAFLLPPNQRSIARFMNLFEWVDWGKRVLHNYPKLSEEQKESLSFVIKHKNLLEELYKVMECYRYVEGTIKNEGLSLQSVRRCQTYVVKHHIYPDNLMRQTQIMAKVAVYLKKEAALLKTNGQAHNISSDIIESIFGAYKDRESPNKLYGVTAFVLFIPAYTRIMGMTDNSSVDVKHIMSAVKLKDLEDWKDKNLLKNWVTERGKILKKVG